MLVVSLLIKKHLFDNEALAEMLARHRKLAAARIESIGEQGQTLLKVALDTARKAVPVRA